MVIYLPIPDSLVFANSIFKFNSNNVLLIASCPNEKTKLNNFYTRNRPKNHCATNKSEHILFSPIIN